MSSTYGLFSSFLDLSNSILSIHFLTIYFYHNMCLVLIEYCTVSDNVYTYNDTGGSTEFKKHHF